MIRKTNLTPARHAELVSASIVQQRSGTADKWALERSHRKVKRVQGDGVSE
jgi:hypothetical protein